MSIISLTTGTTRGIGRAIFSALSEVGDAYWINRTMPEAAGAGGWICDLSNSEEVAKTCESILKSNIPLDCLVLNAAHRIFAPINELSVEHFTRSLQVNAISNFMLLRGLADLLERSNGTVIICGSQAGSYPAEQAAAYCSSKAALDMLARVFMYEYRHRGIRVSILEMGAVRNRPKPNDGWKIDPVEVASAVRGIISAKGNALISRIEIIPREIPRGDEAGPERLHRL